jgi:Fe-Mn family superoxide dismutase
MTDSKNALKSHISAETFEFHYGKHHAARVNNLNNLIGGTEFKKVSREDIILKSSGGIFNKAAQKWNHTFYWNCLKLNGGSEPTGSLAETVKSAFGVHDPRRS